jgi:hypothetical protein
MPIYRMSAPGVFRGFAPTPFQEFESKLEEWIEANPHLLFPGETVAIIGRQTATAFGKHLDLLGLDESGATVVVELKRGIAPRDAVAQTLEYAAWVDSLDLAALDDVAKAYAARHDKTVAGVMDLYREAFDAHEEEPEESVDSATRVTFNTRQRMVIVAESFSPELTQTLRYLRTKLGVDISGIRFGIHQLDDDLLIETETLVGREPREAVVNKSAVPPTPESQEQTRSRVLSDFVREQVGQLEGWIAEQGGPDLEIRHLGGSNCAIYSRGKRLFSYYFAQRWIHFGIPAPTDHERAVLRQLDHSKVLERETWAACNLHTARDLETVRPLLADRLSVA